MHFWTQDGVALTAVRVPRPLKRAPLLPHRAERHAVLRLARLLDTRAQHTFGQGKVLRVGHLEVLSGTFH